MSAAVSRLASLALLLGLLLASSAAAPAATCTVSNATLSFGAYNPIAATPTTASSTLTVSCGELLGGGSSSTVNYSIQLSGGNSGDPNSREMRLLGAALPYNVYTSASYATVWDHSSGVAGSISLQGPLGLPVLVFGNASQTVYGRILAQRPAASGAYTDSLVVTVTY